MEPERYRRSIKILWSMVVLGLGYSGLVYLLRDEADFTLFQGMIGVLLGLYICSHPATNAVNLMFYSRSTFQQLTTGKEGFNWLALNTLVMLIGWTVIVIGATQFVHQ